MMPTKMDVRALVFIAALAAVAALILLAGGLSSLEFRPGMRLPVLEDTASGNPGSFYSNPTLLILMMIAMLLLIIPTAIFMLIRYPDFRRRILSQLMILLFFSLLFYMTSNRLKEVTEEVTTTPQVMGSLENGETGLEQRIEIDTYLYRPDSRMIGLVSLLLAAVVLWTGWVGFRRYQQSRIPYPTEQEQIMTTAQTALQQIRTGDDIRNVILRCYHQMNEIVAEKHNVHRASYLTPREFAYRLEQRGLPAAEVQRLTRLFELVRYGAKTTGPAEEAEAQACLLGLVKALGGQM